MSAAFDTLAAALSCDNDGMCAVIESYSARQVFPLHMMISRCNIECQIDSAHVVEHPYEVCGVQFIKFVDHATCCQLCCMSCQGSIY